MKHVEQKHPVVYESYKQESSAKLTNQRISYAFTSSPLSFHARHIFAYFQVPA